VSLVLATNDLLIESAIMPRDPVNPTDATAAVPASSGSDLPLPWRELLHHPLTTLDHPPDPDLFADLSLWDLCSMAGTW
jgi:hypothetical protein